MMEEDALTNLSVCLKLSVTVWDFILPRTPSLPAVFGVSILLLNLMFEKNGECFTEKIIDTSYICLYLIEWII